MNVGRPINDECDSPERIRQCINCPYDAEFCNGTDVCHDNSRQISKADVDTARYAWKRGYNIRQISTLIGKSETFVRHALKTE